MTRDKFLEMIERDLTIESDNLDLFSINTPYLVGKYLKERSRFKGNLIHAKNKYVNLKKWKRDYYLGLQPKSVYDEQPFDLKIRKTDVDIYLETDVDIQELYGRVEFYEDLCDSCNYVLKALELSGWNIKNAIADRNFKHGIM
jgi:hypothetical protein